MFGYIICILGFIVLYTGILYFPRGENRFSLVAEMIWSCVGVLCAGGAIAFALQMLSVPISISTIGIGYLGMGMICWIYIRKKGKNSFHIDRTEVCGIIFLSAIFLVGAFKVFTVNLLLNYSNPVDPAVHFRMAKEVVIDQKIDHMFFSAFHNAMFIELLSPFFDQLHWYKAFILADSFQNYVNLLAFYALVLGYMRNKKQRVAAIIITLLYWMGYPLYSYIGGNFVYWGTGVTLVAYIFALLEGQYCRKYTNLYTIIGTCLGLFSLAFCYIQFVPVMVVGTVMILVLNIKNRGIVKRLSWKQYAVLGTIIAICLAAGASVCYKVIFKGYNISILDALKAEGGIYRGLLNDFVFLIPIVILYIVYSIKNNRKEIEVLFFAGWLGYVFLFGILMILGRISTYYYFKNYYPFWLAFWIIIAKAVLTYRKQYRLFLSAYLTPILLILILMVGGAEKNIYKEIGEPNAKINQIVGIYGYNWEVLQDRIGNQPQSAAREQLLEWVSSELLAKEISVPCIYSIDCQGEREWYDVITDQESGEYFFGIWDDNNSPSMLERKLMCNDKQYVAVFKNSHPYRQCREILEQYETVFENEQGVVLKLSCK